MTALAPDASSLAAARRLARPGPWSDTGSTDTLVWGKCQGSGKTPYQVSVDLTGPAFRCTCPSRKVPCKHGLALLMLWVEGAGAVQEAAEAPGLASGWAAERAARARAREAASAAQADRSPDPAARARRLEERLALMTGGMEDFARWLGDLARGGIAGARSQPYSWWDTTAARLVDSQLPGLADQVRSMAGEVNARPDWPEHLLAALGRWWMATQAWSRRDTLDEDETGDLRTVLGWSVPTESVRRREALTDRWTVLGAHRTDDGRLQQQRTWLHGEDSGETVQVLDFAAGGQVLPVAQVVGSVLHAAVARYPGRAARRALFVDEPVVVSEAGGLPRTMSVEEAHATAAATWSRNPWAWRVPVVLGGVRATVIPGPELETTRRAGRPQRPAASAAPVAAALVDASGDGVRLTDDSAVWLLLALTAGQPTDVVVELEGRRARPLSAVVDGGLVTL